ncbi:hypothetical protein SASPL_124831 [Salvia splendens]|uniref:Uncharacterized protein n=1 Tax=Salvia splendens TaxID=180675 RepID=A0A8X8XE71_SALSN|nr:hypothetical protein SASPL_124831 [Salvia splendens]
MASLYLYAPLTSSPHASRLNFSAKPLLISSSNAHQKRLFFSGNASSSTTKLIAASSSANNASTDSATPSDSGARLIPETLLNRQRKPKDAESSVFDKFFTHIWNYSIWGLIAPTLDLKLGLGGTSYAEFISKMHLPMQLSQVDHIVASFSGGAVGVISALMLLEINNVEQQEKKRCKYCHGTGYMACASCSASGLCVSAEPLITSATDRPLNAPTTGRCQNCSGSGKVMCPTCLCTGMIMASEHDPRFAPFD